MEVSNMESKWFRIYNPIGGHTVGRLKNADRPMYSGNVEYAPNAGYIEGDEGMKFMDELAEKLNDRKTVCYEWIPHKVAFRVYQPESFADTLAYASSRKEIYEKADEMNWEVREVVD
jgi:hypothetical protein